MNLYLKYQSPNTFSSKDIVQLKVYQNLDKIQSHKFRSLGTKKLGQSSKSRSQGQKSWYQKKGLFIMHLFLNYQSPNTFGSKDIAQVKVFQN